MPPGVMIIPSPAITSVLAPTTNCGCTRYLSPGAVTAADIIENDLDSHAVAGPRTDQARETHLHGQIYKARPDVMAIVHAHTPELVAFGMSSVPLWHGESRVPVWDIRRLNEGRTGTVQTPVRTVITTLKCTQK